MCLSLDSFSIFASCARVTDTHDPVIGTYNLGYIQTLFPLQTHTIPVTGTYYLIDIYYLSYRHTLLLLQTHNIPVTGTLYTSYRPTLIML